MMQWLMPACNDRLLVTSLRNDTRYFCMSTNKNGAEITTWHDCLQSSHLLQNERNTQCSSAIWRKRGTRLLREMKWLGFQFQKDKKYHNDDDNPKIVTRSVSTENTAHRPPKMLVDGLTCLTENHPLPVLFLLGLFTRMYSHHHASPSISPHHNKYFAQ